MNKIDYDRVVESPTELELYKALSRKLLDYLKCSRPSTWWDLVRFVGGSDRRILRLLDQMVQAGLVSFANGYFASTSVVNVPISSREALCPTCQGKIVVLAGAMQRISKIMAEIYQRRPKPTFVFDQRPVTLDTTLRRVAYLIWRGDLQGKRVAVIGDDDLTSLAIALTGMACSISVIDIDERLIAFLKQEAMAFNLCLDIVHADLTQGIPSKYCHKFDIFLTDPTPIQIPFTLFVNTGIRLLKHGPSHVGYASIYSSGMEKSLALQKVLTHMGLLITDLIPHFTEYEFIQETYSPADIKLLETYSLDQDRLSFFESLVRFETTNETDVVPLKFTLKDMFGTATERVLADLSKDPTVSGTDEDRSYVRNAAATMIQNKDREIVV